MFKNTSKHAIAVATIAAISAMAGLARADDGGSEDYMIPAAYAAGDDNGGTVATCADVRAIAWFNHELERSDGEVSPKGDEPVCKPEFYAESTADAD